MSEFECAYPCPTPILQWLDSPLSLQHLWGDQSLDLWAFVANLTIPLNLSSICRNIPVCNKICCFGVCDRLIWFWQTRELTLYWSKWSTKHGAVIAAYFRWSIPLQHRGVVMHKDNPFQCRLCWSTKQDKHLKPTVLPSDSIRVPFLARSIGHCGKPYKSKPMTSIHVSLNECFYNFWPTQFHQMTNLICQNHTAQISIGTHSMLHWMHHILSNIIFLGQIEELPDLTRTLWTPQSWLLLIRQAREFLFTFKAQKVQINMEHELQHNLKDALIWLLLININAFRCFNWFQVYCHDLEIKNRAQPQSHTTIVIGTT